MSNEFLNRSFAGDEMEPRLMKRFPEATENEGDSMVVPRWLVMQLHKEGKLCLAAYTHHREFLHSHSFVDPNEVCPRPRHNQNHDVAKPERSNKTHHQAHSQKTRNSKHKKRKLEENVERDKLNQKKDGRKKVRFS